MSRKLALVVFSCLALVLQSAFAGVGAMCLISSPPSSAVVCKSQPQAVSKNCQCKTHNNTCCEQHKGSGTSSQKHNANANCNCELSAAQPFATTTAALNVAGYSIIATIPATFATPVENIISVPGIVGTDSGPPGLLEHLPDLGRAPPVA